MPSQHRVNRVRVRAELPPGAVETLAAGFGKLLHGPFLAGSRELHKYLLFAALGVEPNLRMRV